MDYMKLRRTLIDNSDNGFNMAEALRSCFHDQYVTEVDILGLLMSKATVWQE